MNNNNLDLLGSLGRSTTNANQREAQHAEFSPGPKRSPKGVELCNHINHYMFIPNRRNLIVSLRPECAFDGYLIENTWKARMREHIADLIRPPD